MQAVEGLKHSDGMKFQQDHPSLKISYFEIHPSILSKVQSFE
jgi:hypothetical protein